MGLKQESINKEYAREQIAAIRGMVMGKIAFCKKNVDNEDFEDGIKAALEIVEKCIQPRNLNPEGLKMVYSKQFLFWLKEEPIENQNEFSMQSLYEIYINEIMWSAIPKDPELPNDHLKLRM